MSPRLKNKVGNVAWKVCFSFPLMYFRTFRRLGTRAWLWGYGWQLKSYKETPKNG
jgi:hypothetical protein